MDKSYLTAIGRLKPSTPARLLDQQGLLKGRCLDYGSGRGKDAKHFKIYQYDPYFHPSHPSGKFDTIICNYVLNVVDQNSQERIINKIRGLLNPNGVAYFTVRRDIKQDYVSSKGTLQRLVHLNLPVFKETNDFCIYILKG